MNATDSRNQQIRANASFDASNTLLSQNNLFEHKKINVHKWD